ncbi:MAG: DUF2892 domain-containing protein [Bryobacterales bacterium]|nr:DUF2892 domain-containing protein [Bryobacterales bacterium]
MNRLFPTNEHTVERVARVAIGLGAIALAITGPQTPWGWLGIIPLATGLLGSCPLYTLLGISTCPLKSKSSQV